MTQQPPLEPPEPTEGSAPPDQPPSSHPPRPSGDGSEHTAPLWYSQEQGQPQDPAYVPAAPHTADESHPSGFSQDDGGSAQRARPRRLVELVAVALVAAILSSAGTYALTRGDVEAAPTAQSRTTATVPRGPVVQANPAAPDWTVTAAAVSPSVVAISVVRGQSGGQGSGVILDAEGHVLTNNHVVAAGGQGSKISVTLNDKRTYDATIVGTDPSSDLAVIKLVAAPSDLKVIALGDDQTLKVGEPVMAVGNPLGLAGTVTTGIVSALNRPVTTDTPGTADPFGQQAAGEPVVTNAVQTSAPINPGNSGGALVNGSGRLIGINSAIAQLGATDGGQGGNIGIGFAIPVDESKSVADQLIRSGKVSHAFLGVFPRDAVVIDGPAKRPAAAITSVTPGGPADKAGLEPGDAITAVDGVPVDGALSLIAQVRERAAGEKVALKVLRDGQARDVTVILSAKPTTNQ